MKQTINLPSGYDWNYSFRATLKANLQRLDLLIGEAISRTDHVTGYELFGVSKNHPIDDFYCLKIHGDEDICIVSTSVRGIYKALAIFPITHLYAAAEYFVNRMTVGKVEINWELFLDLE